MFPQLGILEMLVVMGVAVLLFGKRLPEVGRSLGKGIIEFKKGLRRTRGDVRPHRRDQHSLAPVELRPLCVKSVDIERLRR